MTIKRTLKSFASHEMSVLVALTNQHTYKHTHAHEELWFLVPNMEYQAYISHGTRRNSVLDELEMTVKQAFSLSEGISVLVKCILHWE